MAVAGGHEPQQEQQVGRGIALQGTEEQAVPRYQARRARANCLPGQLSPRKRSLHGSSVAVHLHAA